MGVEKIRFRCWFCNKRYSLPRERIGERFPCACERLIRVPKRNGGNSKARTLTDWLVEAIAYGGGGALLGFGFAVLVLARIWILRHEYILILVWTVVGFFAGLFLGERGINWLGRKIRDQEDQ